MEDKKSHTGVWAVVTNDWQHNMFGVLRTCFFRPERTWANCKKSPGNAGTKGDITAYRGYLHMNAYPVFLKPRLKAGSAEQEVAKDNGKILDTGIKGIFGGDLVPEFCFSTSKLTTGIQYSEGQEVTFNAHNQVANFSISCTEDQKAMGFSKHIIGIRWKILEDYVVQNTMQLSLCSTCGRNTSPSGRMMIPTKSRMSVSRIPGGNSSKSRGSRPS